jgi:hypothetical protein
LFFTELRGRVGAMLQAGKSAREIHNSVDAVRADLTAQSRIARYVGGGLPSQVEKVLEEMTGQGFPQDAKSAKARLQHATAHGWHV